MSFIKSRKHAVPVLPLSLALGALGALASADSLAQSAAPATASAPIQTLPAIKAVAGLASDFKPEQLASPKFAKPLLDTPQTATVISKELLQAQGVSSLTEALANTPGITMALGENGYTATGDAIIMRGFESGTSIFVDGARDLGGLGRDTFDTEQVEVVKGPVGADNGRGVPSGYINLVSKRPMRQDLQQVQARVGTAGRLRLEADINRSLDRDTGLAWRLNAFHDQGHAADRDQVKHRRWGVAPTVAIGLGQRSTAVLSYRHLRQDNVPDGGLPAVGRAGYESLHVYAGAADWDKGQKVSGLAPLPRKAFYGSAQDFNRGRADMATAQLEHRFTPDTVWRSTVRYARTHQQIEMSNLIIVDRATAAWLAPYTVTGQPDSPASWTVHRFRFGQDRVNTLQSAQNMVSTRWQGWGGEHHLSAGADLVQESQTDLAFSYDARQQQRASLYAPNAADRFAPLQPTGASTEGRTLTGALYLFDVLDLSPAWQVHGGLRWDRYRTEAHSHPAPGAGAQATRLTKSGTLAGAKLGLVYKPDEASSLYLAWSTSQKPPGSDSFALNAGQSSGPTRALNVNAVQLEPQQARHLELGGKWEPLGRRVQLSAALYETENRNDLAREGEAGAIVQYGRRRVRGLELSAAGALHPLWQVQAGLAAMNTRIVQSAVLAPGGVDSQTGAALRFSPRLSATAWVQHQPRAASPWRMGLGWRYQASQASAENNGATPISGVTAVPAYEVVDAMLSYAWARSARLQLNVSNLFDKDYMAAVNYGRNRALMGSPRQISLALRSEF